jgi:hypothetical protein
MRKPLILPLAIAVVGLALGVAGCGSAPGESVAQSTPGESVAQSTPGESVAQSTPGSDASASPDARPAVLWTAPPDPMARTIEAGLKPGPKEYKINHVHAHLDVFVDGKPITVPAGIGIKIDDPAVHRFGDPDGTVGYGGINLFSEPCISPLHTHDVTGIIHTESLDLKSNTLGEFFVEWDVVLSGSCVGEFCSPKAIAFYVNGKPYMDDPGAIELTDQKEIAIVIGTPPPVIPSAADFSKA